MTVTVWDALVLPSIWFANERLWGTKASGEVWATPASVTDCGLLAALSATSRAPTRLPFLVGLNVTAIVHCAPAKTDEPQLLV